MSKWPALRFKGYTKVWEHYSVDDIANRYDNMRIPVAANLRVPGTTPYYGANGIQDYVDGYTHEGEFVLVAEDGANDLKNYPVKCVTGKIWVNNHAHVLQGKQGVTDNHFLAYSINHANIESLLVGGGRAKLNAETLMKIELDMPEISEQQSIGLCIARVDSLVNFHQRKYDKLLTYKKAMLEKMFPKDGADVPEVRFAGYTLPWIRRKLSDVLERRQIIQQITPDAPRLAFAAGQGVIPLSERKTNNRDQLISDEMSKRYLLTELNDIVYNPANLKYGAIDRNKYGKGVISPIYVTFTTTEVPSFIELIVTAEKFKLKALQFEEGTVVKRQSVSPENLLSFEEMISPYEAEQEAIGSFFDKLNRLITNTQRKTERLQAMKRALLEKMFI